MKNLVKKEVARRNGMSRIGNPWLYGFIPLFISCALCLNTSLADPPASRPSSTAALQDPKVALAELGNGISEITITPASDGQPIKYRLDLSKNFLPETKKDDPTVARWERYRLGAFVCYNTNQFTGKEWCSSTAPAVHNPSQLDVAGWAAAFRKAGMKYAVLTVRHTSGFLLWDSPTTFFHVGNSGNKTNIVKAFVEECRKQGIAPGFYYCMWGGPASLQHTRKQDNAAAVNLAQLYELATRFGPIEHFWIDMMNWAPKELPAQKVYNLLKTLQPGTFVLMNQHVQDGRKIAYFPTDGLNGEVCLPPNEGHNPWREVNGTKYYLPFEFEPVSQARTKDDFCHTPMGGGVWFTYGAGKAFTPSTPFPAEPLAKWIQDAWSRGASNVLLSCAPDHTGRIRPEDAKQLEDLGKLLSESKAMSQRAVGQEQSNRP